MANVFLDSINENQQPSRTGNVFLDLIDEDQEKQAQQQPARPTIKKFRSSTDRIVSNKAEKSRFDAVVNSILAHRAGAGAGLAGVGRGALQTGAGGLESLGLISPQREASIKGGLFQAQQQQEQRVAEEFPENRFARGFGQLTGELGPLLPLRAVTGGAAFGATQVLEPGQSRAKAIGTGLGLGALGVGVGAGLRGFGKGISKRTPEAIQKLQQAAEKAGLPGLTLGQLSGAKGLQSLTNFLAKIPVIGTKGIFRKSGRLIEKRILELTKKNASIDDIGDRIVNDLKLFERAATGETKKIFNSDSLLRKATQDQIDVDKLFQSFITKNAPKRAGEIISRVQPATREGIKARVLNDAYNKALIGERLVPQRFVKEIRNLGKTADVVFSKKELAELKGFAKMVDSMDEGLRIAGRPPAISLAQAITAGAAGTGVFTGTISAPVAFGVALFIKGLSKVMTSPKLAKVILGKAARTSSKKGLSNLKGPIMRLGITDTMEEIINEEDIK